MNRIIAATAAAALTAGSLALTAPAGAAPAKARTYKVTAKANIDVAVAKEDTVKIRGRVTPKAWKQKVVLQQRVGDKKKWRKTDKVMVKRNGRFLLKDTPTTPGMREYRVLKPGHKGIRKGYSKPMAVEVYRWEKLGNWGTGPQENLLRTGAVIGTEYYGASFMNAVSGTPAYVEYTLARKCTQLRSTYALTDSSVSGSSGAIVVSADGVPVKTHSLAVGTIVKDDVADVTDVFRLRFDIQTTATPAATAAVAGPEVLCTR